MIKFSDFAKALGYARHELLLMIDEWRSERLTRRDRLAMAALPLFAGDISSSNEQIAIRAYLFAEAMMMVREELA